MEGDTLAGRLLVASPTLLDPNFLRTVVLVLQHDDDGALGVVLNRPTGEPVTAHLPAWSGSLAEPAVVFAGGPVEPAVAIGLGRDLAGAEPTGVPSVGIVDLAGEPGPLDVVRIFSGYAGWGPGQLEGELEEEAWIVLEADPGDPFSTEPEGLWRRVLRRQGGRMAMLATMPIDPAWN